MNSNRILLVLTLLALLVVPVMGNTLYGIVWDDEHLVGVNGVTVYIWNATHYLMNTTSPYGPMFIPGVFYIEGLPAESDYFLNASKAGFFAYPEITINTGGYENKTVIAGVDGKIYTSYDSGDTWGFASNLAGERNTTSISNLGLGYGQLATTSTNGYLFNLSRGVNWQYVTNTFGIDSGSGPGRANKKPLLSLGGGAALVGLSSGYHSVWNTTNSGLTWSATTGWWANRSAYQFAQLGTNVTAVTNAKEIWNSTDSGFSWTKKATLGTSTIAGWTVRTTQSSILMPDGSIVLTGGSDGTNWYNDTWRSTDRGITWAQINASSVWSKRNQHSTVVMPDGSIVLTGGDNGAGTYYNDVWKSVDGGNIWTQVNGSAAWSKRTGHSTIALSDGTIILMGGSESVARLNDVWKSVDGGNIWTQVNGSAAWNKRWGFTTVLSTSNTIILMGGFSDTGYTKNVYKSTDGGNIWTQQTSSAGWSARALHTSVAMPDGSIVLMGGHDGVRKNDVWRSVDQGVTWTQMSGGATWEIRSGHTSVAMPDGSIVLMGGANAVGTWYNNVWGSTNNGITWEMVGTATSIINLGNGKGLAGTYNQTGEIWNTLDYGLTWTKRASLTNVINVETLCNLNNGNILAGVWGNFTSPLGTHQAQIWNSTNNGTTWQIAYNFTGETEVPSLLYLGNSEVLAGTFPSGKVWHSRDNGTTWMDTGSLGVEVGALSLMDLEYGLRKDLFLGHRYNVTFDIRDAESGARITAQPVFISTDGIITTSVSTSTGIATVGNIPDGWLGTSTTTVDYTPDYRTMYVSTDINVTVNMTPLFKQGNILQDYPHYVVFRTMKLTGGGIPDVAVTAQGYMTSTGSYDWLVDWIGIPIKEAPIHNTTMSATTDDYGAVTFLMVPTVKYNMTFTLAGYTFTNLRLMPQDNEYIIYPTGLPGAIFYPTAGMSELEAVNISITTGPKTASVMFVNISYYDKLGHTMGGYVDVLLKNETPFGANLINYRWNVSDQKNPWTGALDKNNWTNSSEVSHVVQVSGFVNTNVTNTDFGYVKRSYGFTFNSIPVSFLGFGYEIALLVAMGIMLFTAMLGGASSAKQVAFIVCIEAWVFYAMHWFDALIDRGVPAEVISMALLIATVFAFVSNMGVRKRKEKY